MLFSFHDTLPSLFWYFCIVTLHLRFSRTHENALTVKRLGRARGHTTVLKYITRSWKYNWSVRGFSCTRHRWAHFLLFFDKFSLVYTDSSRWRVWSRFSEKMKRFMCENGDMQNTLRLRYFLEIARLTTTPRLKTCRLFPSLLSGTLLAASLAHSAFFSQCKRECGKHYVDPMFQSFSTTVCIEQTFGVPTFTLPCSHVGRPCLVSPHV
jgi:hypothetical protein